MGGAYGLKRTCPWGRRVAHATDLSDGACSRSRGRHNAHRMRLAPVPADRSRWDVRSHARGDLASDQTEYRIDRSNGGRPKFAQQAGERNHLRSPARVRLLCLRSVKGRCAQASPALDPATALLYGTPDVHRCVIRSQFRAKRLDNLLLIEAFPERVVGSACASAFSRFAQRSLTLRPAHSRCHQFVTRLPEGFSHFVTSMTAPVASGWSGCRAGLAPAGKRRLFTAHTHVGRWTLCKPGVS